MPVQARKALPAVVALAVQRAHRQLEEKYPRSSRKGLYSVVKVVEWSNCKTLLLDRWALLIAGRDSCLALRFVEVLEMMQEIESALDLRNIAGPVQMHC